MDRTIYGLVESAWQQFADSPRERIVTPSIPILFFGDLASYESSPIRIVTVALNPSNQEFPERSPFSRFPAAKNLTFPFSQEAAQLYVTSLSRYFTTNPYDRWFRPGFEPILQGLGASYYGDSNTALHTDICSPLATKDTWSKLPPKIADSLNQGGSDLWHRLVGHLDPDLILISVAKRYCDQIHFEGLTDWESFHTIQREHPYTFETKSYRLPSRKKCLALFGRPVNIPFGSVSGTDKIAVGRRLLEAIHA